MPRPVKCRRVEFFPKDTYFIPLGKGKWEVEEIELKFEEVEAMRLKDIEGLSQEECAERMEVSRQTFQNIIDSARNKVAKALTEGKAIHITGGNYISSSCQFKCLSCGKIYDFNQQKYNCPKCGNSERVCKKKNRLCHKRPEK
ncbi:Predicted DNA-binding protein, UPF0251 family [Anaerobranca californiensis DSM 14826]|jgi:predicted DNA-binding protein (UPF0251 family)|uniref:UPF0251 protein SAMN02745227_00929 n=1 Tax=Anaerobranca californiensis DSM 14826 TaxID=1120989 RepID=A0A1M6MWI4_9FIRM|nr:DUF134 domain-containing protein [Anaerobranca californiensis]SHJ87831.1 Predicted DNA-binding protein, UPF0251 family [Anaerobranca californiensis DSM 14826]